MRVELVCVFLLLALTIGCYNDCAKVFLLENEQLELCNNSAILINDLSVYGLHIESPKWWLPNGTRVPISPTLSSAIFSQNNNKLRNISGNYYIGIYTYTSSSQPIMIGIYSSFNNVLLVTVSASISVHDYFNQSLTLHLECRISNYPPTCLTWSRNGISFSAYSNSVILNNASTVYSNSMTVSPGDSGNYSCSVISNGTILLTKTDNVIIEGPPTLSSLELLSADSLKLQLNHDHDTSHVMLVVSYDIYYKEIDFNSTVNIELCDNSIDYCILNGLKANIPYSIVIGRNNNSLFEFLPSDPYYITIEEPGPIENNSIVSLLSYEESGVSLVIEWTPVFLQNSTNISFTSSCHMEECMNGHITSTVNFTNITGLIEGLNYTVSLIAINALGSSSPTYLSAVNQLHKVPSTSVSIMIDTDSINETSFSLYWDLMSCCNASGEIPYYMLTLIASDSTTDRYNVTTTQYTFNDLNPGTHYTVSMAAYNTVGRGPVTIQTIILPLPNSTSIPPTTPTSSPVLLPFYLIILAVGLATLVTITVCCSIMICCVMRECNKKRPIGDQVDLEFSSPLYSPFEMSSRCEVPYVIEFPTDTKAVEGETIHFLVRIGGYPEPSYSWQHLGEPLACRSNLQIFSDGTLVIENIRLEDVGQYTFNAQNIGGTLNRVVNLNVVSVDEDESENLQLSTRSLAIEHKPIPVNALEKYVEMQHSYENRSFIILYTSLSQDNNHMLCRTSTCNTSKNRYKNIVPYDSNTVELDPLGEWKELEGTYINASYIDGYNQMKKFIATQGPLPNTVGDFWRMIWKEKCHVIVMLTNKIERNRVKCEQYWNNKDLQIGPYIIQLNSEETFANFVIRNFNILLTDGSQSSQQVRQFHYTAWPDHGVPDHGSPLVLFLQKVMRYLALTEGPITVHCSAGIGRTGTFIALDIGLDQIKSVNHIDLVSIINRLREQRMKMVQTSHQFVFLYDTILEQVLCGNTLIHVAKFPETIARLDSEGNDILKKTGFETQFQLLKRITIKITDYKCDVGKEYLEKNRPSTPLPSDTRRVVLKGQGCDYINASYIDGYQQKKEFIIAQSPLPQTTAEFWTMVFQHNSSTIVMLCNLSENSKVMCHHYWPVSAESADVFGHLSIKLINEVTETNSIIRRTIGIKNMNSGKCTTVTQLQVTSWLSDGQCANHWTIAELYTLVTDNQRGSGSKPIIIHCSDGITRSAMYCVTHNAIEQAKLEQASDIFQAVKALNMQRPGSIPQLHNYQTIHELVNCFLCNFVTYNQFQNEYY